MKKTTSWTRELTNPITTHNPELHSFQFMCWPCNICNPESYRTYWSLAKQNCTNYTVQKRPPAIQTCKARHSLQKFVESVFLCRLKEHSGIGFYTVHCQNKQVAYVCIPLTWLLYIKGKTLWQPELLDFLKMIVVLLFGVCIVPVWAPRKKKNRFQHPKYCWRISPSLSGLGPQQQPLHLLPWSDLASRRKNCAMYRTWPLSHKVWDASPIKAIGSQRCWSTNWWRDIEFVIPRIASWQMEVSLLKIGHTGSKIQIQHIEVICQNKTIDLQLTTKIHTLTSKLGK